MSKFCMFYNNNKKLNDNKCQTWIKTFSEVEDPYFDLDPAEFLNRSPDEFLIFQLY